jgi:hypothetical protein
LLALNDHEATATGSAGDFDHLDAIDFQIRVDCRPS